jgi:hypothetical protein
MRITLSELKQITREEIKKARRVLKENRNANVDMRTYLNNMCNALFEYFNKQKKSTKQLEIMQAFIEKLQIQLSYKADDILAAITKDNKEKEQVSIRFHKMFYKDNKEKENEWKNSPPQYETFYNGLSFIGIYAGDKEYFISTPLINENTLATDPANLEISVHKEKHAGPVILKFNVTVKTGIDYEEVIRKERNEQENEQENMNQKLKEKLKTDQEKIEAELLNNHGQENIEFRLKYTLISQMPKPGESADIKSSTIKVDDILNEQSKALASHIAYKKERGTWVIDDKTYNASKKKFSIADGKACQVVYKNAYSDWIEIKSNDIDDLKSEIKKSLLKLLQKPKKQNESLTKIIKQIIREEIQKRN